MRKETVSMIDGHIDNPIIDSQIKYIRSMVVDLDKVRLEAIKGFATKLKEEAIDYDMSSGCGRECYLEVVPVIVIDKLLADMTKIGDDEE